MAEPNDECDGTPTCPATDHVVDCVGEALQARWCDEHGQPGLTCSACASGESGVPTDEMIDAAMNELRPGPLLWSDTQETLLRTQVERCLRAALDGLTVVDLPVREEVRGFRHPAWPDPLSFNWGDDPRENARQWLAENREKHPQIIVRHRYVTDWAALDLAAGSGGSSAVSEETPKDEPR